MERTEEIISELNDRTIEINQLNNRKKIDWIKLTRTGGTLTKKVTFLS